ncbi:hypothetical protein Misp01_58150 [Microtetraspora sp. NBRC 13810]|nr:hypothetical protein [Microtetraspora sp. NBRC 13810]GLW10687.1 hypothetical protein Misp01_58150 [Microtetraspora sp. NBRC 13810]
MKELEVCSVMECGVETTSMKVRFSSSGMRAAIAAMACSCFRTARTPASRSPSASAMVTTASLVSW